MSEPQGEVPIAALAYETQGTTSAPVLGAVGLKLLGIYFMLQITGLSTLAWLFNANIGGTQLTGVQLAVQVIAFTLPILLQVAVGVMLFLKAETWAARWFGHHGSSTPPVVRGDVVVLIIGGIGLWMVVGAVPLLMRDAVNLMSNRSRSFISYSTEGWVNSVARFAIGLCMLLFAPKLSRFGNRLFRPTN